jgi:hypothetical protein
VTEAGTVVESKEISEDEESDIYIESESSEESWERAGAEILDTVLIDVDVEVGRICVLRISLLLGRRVSAGETRV